MVAGLWLSVVTFVPFALAAVPVLLFIAWDLRRRPPPISAETLVVSRTVSEQKALRGEPVRVELRVENRGPDVKVMLVNDFPPREAKVVRGSTALLCPLKAGGRARLRYEVTFDEPGEFSFLDPTFRASSSFGLSESATTIRAPASIRVYPKRTTEETRTARARAFAWAGNTASKYRGGRVEFMDIRAYSPGDPLKSINWRASARAGRTLVNEWQADRGLDCVILVDLSPRNLPRVGEWSARTSVITASYELAGSLLDSGNRVGMLIMGDMLHKVRPGFGSRHLKKMVEYLVQSKEGEVWSLGHAEPFLELFFRRQYSTRGGTLFFVMAGADELALETVGALSKRGFVCNSVLVSTLSQEAEGLVATKSLGAERVEFGTRMVRAENEAYKTAFARVSNVYEWSEGRGFAEVGGRAGR